MATSRKVKKDEHYPIMIPPKREVLATFVNKKEVVRLQEENERLKNVLRQVARGQYAELKGDYISRVMKLAKDALS